MARGFAIHNAPTDHGGIIPATQMRSSQMGNLFVVVGDGHFCPKCKCWSKVLKSHDHVLFDGKAVAYAGDKLTCGAKILPQQSHVVGDSGGSYDSSTVNPIMPLSNSSVKDNSEIHKIQFQIIDEDTAEPITDILYEIYSKSDGKLLTQGYTDQNGMTTLYESGFSSEAIELITLDLSKPLPPLSQSNN